MFPGRLGTDPDRQLSGSAVGGERVGPPCIGQRELRPAHDGGARDGRKRDFLGHRDRAGGGEADDRSHKADDDAEMEPKDSTRALSGPPRAPGRRCDREFHPA